MNSPHTHTVYIADITGRGGECQHATPVQVEVAVKIPRTHLIWCEERTIKALSVPNFLTSG